MPKHTTDTTHQDLPHLPVRQSPSAEVITDQDKLMGLLAYVIGVIVSLIILLSETGRQSRFQKYHAVQSLLLAAAFVVVDLVVICPIALLVTTITVGCGSLCFVPLIFAELGVHIYYGVKAYQGEYATIPLLTDFANNLGWL